MKRRLLPLLLSLLLLCFAASAAPARSLSAAALESGDLIREIQALADAVASAAWASGTGLLTEGAAPPQLLLESLLVNALRDGLLPFGAADGAVTLSPEEAREAAASLFSVSEIPDMGSPIHQAVTPADGKLRFDLTGEGDFTGAHVYDLALDEDGLTVYADVYRLSGIVASAAEAPEGSLAWLGHITMRLKAGSAAPSGFALSAFSLSAPYEARETVFFKVKDRLELRYPDVFSVPAQDSGAILSLSSPDGSALLSLRAVSGTLETLRQAWAGESLPEGTVVETGENGRLTLRGPGVLRVAVSDPGEGGDGCLLLMMDYPPQRETEFSLYRVFIENSFVVYSNSVG